MRIIYGVNGEGMGHATRSTVVLDELLKKGHEIHIYSSGRAYEMLKKKYDNVYTIKGFNLVYEGDAMKNMHSFFYMMKTMPKDLRPTFTTLASDMVEIKPHIIISDFESFTNLLGNEAGIPVISANNISIGNRTKVDLRNVSQIPQKLLVQVVDTLSTLNATKFVIPTFFFPETRGDNVILTNPVVRKSIQKLKPEDGGHILVYQTSSTNTSLLDLLENLPYDFHVYGFGKMKDRKNMKIHEFNEKQFISTLASSRAVISGGGFSLISEALYLQKPILSVPLRNHFEQITNAHYLEKLKFGAFHHGPDETEIRDFLLKRDYYKYYLSQYTFNPMEFADTISDLVDSLGREPSITRLKAMAALNFTFGPKKM